MQQELKDQWAAVLTPGKLAEKQQGAGADQCLPAHELGAVPLCLPTMWISLGHSHDPGKNWETSFCLNSLAQSIPSLTEKTKRENTNCRYQHWERGHVDFIDTYKKKLSLICCLPSAFPSCVCSLEKGLHQKRKSHQIILFIFLVNKTVQCIKTKTYTTDEREDQDLFCIRILQGADYGPVLWKIIVSLTSSGTRTMKVKTINRCVLKICESVGSISEMKTDVSLIPSRIACSLCCRLVAKLCSALLRPHGL